MLILISQKMLVDRHGAMLEALERNYIVFFSRLGTVIPVPNNSADAASLVEALAPGLLVLSGGNNVDPAMFGSSASLGEVFPARDETERVLFETAVEKGLPILGVCRGAQFMNVLLGGSLTPGLADHPPGQSHEVDYSGERSTVNSFHDHGIRKTDLAKGLKPLVLSDDGLVEAYGGSVDRSKILGVQWHPERADSNPSLFNRLMADILPEVPW